MNDTSHASAPPLVGEPKPKPKSKDRHKFRGKGDRIGQRVGQAVGKATAAARAAKFVQEAQADFDSAAMQVDSSVGETADGLQVAPVEAQAVDNDVKMLADTAFQSLELEPEVHTTVAHTAPLHVELEYTMNTAGVLVGRPPEMTEQPSSATAPVPAGLAVASQHNDQFQFQPIQAEPLLADALSVTGADESSTRVADAFVTPDQPIRVRFPEQPRPRPSTPRNILFMLQEQSDGEGLESNSQCDSGLSGEAEGEMLERRAHADEEEIDERAAQEAAVLLTLKSQISKLGMAHPQPYVILRSNNGDQVLCLCDSGAASFNLMSEQVFLASKEEDPGRYDRLAYRQKPLLVGGIEQGRKAVMIVGQVMQTLYDPGSGRPVRFITAILRNASTGDAEVLFGNRQFASDRWGAKIDFEGMQFVISDLADGIPEPLIIPMVWTVPVKEDLQPGKAESLFLSVEELDVIGLEVEVRHEDVTNGGTVWAPGRLLGRGESEHSLRVEMFLSDGSGGYLEPEEFLDYESALEVDMDIVRRSRGCTFASPRAQVPSRTDQEEEESLQEMCRELYTAKPESFAAGDNGALSSVEGSEMEVDEASDVRDVADAQGQEEEKAQRSCAADGDTTALSAAVPTGTPPESPHITFAVDCLGGEGTKFPVTPHPGSAEYLQQRYDDLLCVDGTLVDAWRTTPLMELGDFLLLEPSVLQGWPADLAACAEYLMSMLGDSKSPEVPRHGTHEYLQRQFDACLYADETLIDVWRHAPLTELNGAELTEAIKHFAELSMDKQMQLMNVISMHAARAEQFLCMNCQGLAWLSREYELFEPDEHLGREVAQGNAKLNPDCTACRNGSRGPCRPDEYRMYMRALFNQSLLYCYLEQQRDDADARRMMFDVSEKRAFVSILREAVDNRQLDLGRFGVDPNAPGLDVDKVYAGVRAQTFGGSFREGIIRIKQQERQRAMQAHHAHLAHRREYDPTGQISPLTQPSSMSSYSIPAFSAEFEPGVDSPASEQEPSKDGSGSRIWPVASRGPDVRRELFEARSDEATGGGATSQGTAETKSAADEVERLIGGGGMEPPDPEPELPYDTDF